MKWFARIFTVYLFVLTVFPCGDDGDCSSPVATLAIALQDHSNHHDEEQCPPLCTCVCCGHQVVKPIASLQLPIPVNPAAKNPTELSFSIKEIYHAIWQPPQLS